MATEHQDREIVAEVNNIMRLTITTANSAYLANFFSGVAGAIQGGNTLLELKSRFPVLANLIRNHPLQNSVEKASECLQEITKFTEGFSNLTELSKTAQVDYLLRLNQELDLFNHEMSNILNIQHSREQKFQEEQAATQQKINTILIVLLLTSIGSAVGMLTFFNLQAARRLDAVMNSINFLSSNYPLVATEGNVLGSSCKISFVSIPPCEKPAMLQSLCALSSLPHFQ